MARPQPDGSAVIVWTTTTLRRLLEHRAACDGVDLSTYAETILRAAVTPPRRSRTPRGHLRVIDKEVPAATQDMATAGTRGSTGVRTRLES